MGGSPGHLAQESGILSSDLMMCSLAVKRKWLRLKRRCSPRAEPHNQWPSARFKVCPESGNHILLIILLWFIKTGFPADM